MDVIKQMDPRLKIAFSIKYCEENCTLNILHTVAYYVRFFTFLQLQISRKSIKIRSLVVSNLFATLLSLFSHSQH